MKKVSCILALFCIVGAALLTGCQKTETTPPPTAQATNAMPAMPATNAPAK